MAYEVPDLPYDYDALEPHIDEATMRVHHDKHHQAYVDKANAALEGTEWADKDVDEVLQNLSSLPDDKQGPVRNNAGGHSNHSLLLEMISPDGGGEPSGDLAAAIDEKFGSFDDFKEEFKNAGVGQFGSGWAWLVHDGSGLAVTSTANQDSPVSDGQTPLLGVDVWEHAYYLKYQNKRPDYLDAFWNVVNWDEVARRFGDGARDPDRARRRGTSGAASAALGHALRRNSSRGEPAWTLAHSGSADRGRRRSVLGLTAGAAIVALALPVAALAHVERPSYWPNPDADTSVTPSAGGGVPTARPRHRSDRPGRDPGRLPGGLA